MASPILQALKFLPASLGVKALEKINPKFRNYFTEAAANGFDTNRALNYIIDRFGNPAQQQFQQQLEGGNLLPHEKAARQQLKGGELPVNLAKGIASAAVGGLSPLMGRGQPEAPQAPKSPFEELASHSEKLANFIKGHVEKGRKPLEAAALASIHDPLKPEIKKVERKAGEPFIDYISRLFQGQATQQPASQATQRPQAAPQQPPQAPAQPQGASRQDQELAAMIAAALKVLPPG